MKLLRWWMILLLGLLSLPFAQGASAPEEDYVRAYDLIQEADELQQKGNGEAALPHYLKAQETLKKVQALSPSWNARLVGYRLRYLADKISGLMQQNPNAATTNAFTTNLTVDAQQQITALLERLKQSEAQNQTLQAKLREALSVQPAAVDPRELSKSESQVRELQKERDQLKVSLAEQQNRNAMAAPDKSAASQKAVDEANHKLAKEVANVVALTKEKESLQKRVKELETENGKTISPTKLRKAQDELAETNRRLAQQHAAAMDLQKQKAELEKQLAAEKTKTGQMRDAELENLQKQVEELGQKYRKQIYTSDEFAMQKAELQLKVEDLNFKLAELNKERAELQKLLKSPPPASK